MAREGFGEVGGERPKVRRTQLGSEASHMPNAAVFRVRTGYWAMLEHKAQSSMVTNNSHVNVEN
jgi:hypothetical protein